MRRGAVVCLIALAALNVAAARLQVNLSRDTLSVGDKTTLTVGVVLPTGTSLEPPDPETAFKPFDVRDWSTGRVAVANGDSATFSYILTLWSAEPCSIPALQFVMGDPEGDTITTEPIPVVVQSVLSGDTIRLRDLKPQQQAGTPSRWWLWLLIGAAVLAALVVLVTTLIQRLRRPPLPPPPPPPFEEALEAFRVLDGRGLVQQGLYRNYVFGLSDIVKHYAERRFGCNAEEWTTEEMLQWIRSGHLQSAQITPAEWFFRTSDPVKFARMTPDTQMIEKFRSTAWQFVDLTRPSLDATVEDTGPTAVTEPKAGA